jgi:hypothetical protein
VFVFGLRGRAPSSPALLCNAGDVVIVEGASACCPNGLRSYTGVIDGRRRVRV